MTMFPKPGIVRVKGKDMQALRIACFLKYGGRCDECNVITWLNAPDEHPRKADMAHIRGKRNHGDSIDNVRNLCHFLPRERAHRRKER